MSITRVAAGAMVTATSGSVSVPLPAGWADEDHAVMLVGGNSLTTGIEPTAPTGWTLRSDHERADGVRFMRGITFFRRLQTGDGDPSITVPTDWEGAAAGGLYATIIAWRGVDASTPFDVADAESDGLTPTSAGLFTPTGVTTATDGAVVVSAAFTVEASALALGTANGFDLILGGADYDSTVGGDLSFGAADITKATAGAQTCPTWDTTVNDATNWVAITFALRPAAPQDSTGSGSPTKTLSKSAAGTASQQFTGSGTPSKTLSKSASGTAAQIFTGSGTPSKTLSISAVGAATYTAPNEDVTGDGAPTVTLSISAEGEATNTKDVFTGSGAANTNLVTSASGTATQSSQGSGTPTKTLAISASGSGTVTFFEGPSLVGVTGPLVSTTTREVAWFGSAATEEDAELRAGDIGLLVIGTMHQDVPSVTPKPGAPGTASVFTKITGATAGVGTPGDSFAIAIEAWWCRATDHDMAPVIIADPGVAVIAAMLVYRDCIETGNPWNVINADTDSPATTTLSVPGATTTVANCLVVAASVNYIDADDPTGVASNIVNASLSNLIQIIDQAFSVSTGLSMVVIQGEKLGAGSYSTTTATLEESVRSANFSLALMPPAPPTPSTGSGTPTKTLTITAVGLGTSTVEGATGAAVATLVATAAGLATQAQDRTGSGAATKTLGVTASGTATSSGVSEVVGSGAPVVTLQASAQGVVFSQPPPFLPPRAPRRAAGGHRRVYVVPDEPEQRQPKPESQQRPARPVVAIPALPDVPQYPPITVSERILDPALWQSLVVPTRATIPVRSHVEVEEEDRFLRILLQVI